MPTYPVILPPSEKQLDFQINYTKRCKHGAIEIVPVAAVAAAGLDGCVRDNLQVTIVGHNYEPDLAYVDEANGVYIDIEIDEPYSTKGIPTHYWENGVSHDDVRNRNFQAAGWYVVRFSERQIFCATKACLKQVCELAVQGGSKNNIPRHLKDIPQVQEDACWTRSESLFRYRSRYRDSYLRMSPSRFRLRYIGTYLRVGWPILWQALFHKHIRHDMFDSLLHSF